MELYFQNHPNGVSSPCKQTKVRERTATNKCSKSGKFVGVRQRPSGKWVAEIKNTTQKIRMWLGTFNTAEEAARAYDEAACLLRGSNTRTNFATHAPTNSPLSLKIRNLLHRKKSLKQNHPPPPAALTTIPTEMSTGASSTSGNSHSINASHASNVVKQDIQMFDDAYRPDLSNCIGEVRLGSSQFDPSWVFPAGSHWLQSTQDGFEFPKHAELLSRATDLDMTEFGLMKVERHLSASFNAMNGVNEYMENVYDSNDAFWDPSLCQLFCTG